MRKLLPYLGFTAVLATLILPIFGVSGYWMRVLSMVFMAVSLSQAMNIMIGLAGYPAMGNLVFFGTGAYMTAILMTKHWAFPLAALASAAVAAVYAALVGLPVLRLKGAYFSIATIGINEATREIVLNLPSLTGGGKGINVPFFPGGVQAQQMFFYYLMWGLGALATAVVWYVRRSRLGYGLRALKADEDAAAVIGVRTDRYKVTAWAISAALTGLTGAAYAYWLSFLEPAPVFDVVLSVKYYIIAILGGAGTIVGPILGAFFLELLSELVWSEFMSLHMLVLGLTVVLVVIFLPKGLVSLLQPKEKRTGQGRRAS